MKKITKTGRTIIIYTFHRDTTETLWVGAESLEEAIRFRKGDAPHGYWGHTLREVRSEKEEVRASDPYWIIKCPDKSCFGKGKDCTKCDIAEVKKVEITEKQKRYATRGSVIQEERAKARVKHNTFINYQERQDKFREYLEEKLANPLHHRPYEYTMPKTMAGWLRDIIKQTLRDFISVEERFDAIPEDLLFAYEIFFDDCIEIHFNEDEWLQEWFGTTFLQTIKLGCK